MEAKPKMIDVTNYPYLTQDPAPGLELPFVIWSEEGRAYCQADEFHAFMASLCTSHAESAK
jgi:hypothetical protein